MVRLSPRSSVVPVLLLLWLGSAATAADLNPGSEFVFNSADTFRTSVTTLDATHVVIAYRDSGNSLFGTAVVGTISGGTTISYGAEYVFNSADTTYGSVTALDAMHVLIAYSDGANSDAGTAIVGTIAGSTITYGAPMVFDVARSTGISATALDASTVAITYRDEGNFNFGTGVVATISGGDVIAYGTPVPFNSADTDFISATTLDSTHVVIGYRNIGGTDFGTAIVGTIAGASISYGAPVAFNSASTDYISAAALDPTKVVIAYQDLSVLHGRAIVGTIAGNVISFPGSAVCFNGDVTIYTSATALDATHAAFSFRDGGNSNFGTEMVATISGTAISFGGRSVFNPGDTRFNFNTALDPSHVVTAYRDLGNGGVGTAVVSETAPTVHFRSIGTDPLNLHSAGNASVPQCSTTVTFTSALPAPTAVGAVGPGDELIIEGESLFIKLRDSDFQVTLESPATVDHSTPTAAFGINRAYTTLQAWEDPCGAVPCLPLSAGGRGGNLVSENRREMGFAYKDGPFVPPFATANSALAINGSNTDADRFMWLTVAPGQRHDGTAGTGVVVDGQGATKFGIQDLDNFSRVEWLELVRFYTDVADSGFSSVVTIGTNALYQNLLVHDFLDPDAGDTGHGIRVSVTAGPWSFTVRNSIIYDGDSAGIRIDESSSSIIVDNCTILGMEDYGVSLGSSGGTATVTNTISMNHGSNSFNALAGVLTQSNNISSDGTAAGASPFTFRTATDVPTAAPNSVVFANLTPTSEDFHLQTSTVNDAVDNGVDLSGSFCCDIDGGLRTTLWDIGADDILATTAVELASFSALGFDGAVELAWETASELDNLGFHVYRSGSESGTYERITTSAIPGLGSSPVGAKYSYRDTDLVNGVTYFYKLEDIETTGRTEFHGPVSAMPNAGAADSDGGTSTGHGDTSPSLITYGDPSSNSLRVLRRSRGHVVLELHTNGFYAEPQQDGSVRITIPDFAELAEAGSPSIPVKRTWVEAVAGRKVTLVSVTAREVEAFTSLRPADAEMPEIVSTRDGTVRVVRR